MLEGLDATQRVAAQALQDAGAELTFGKSGKLRGVRLPAGPGWNERHAELLAALPDLTRLDASGCPVTDAWLPKLARLVELTQLDLSGSGITDAGLLELRPLVKLKLLRLSGCQLSRAALTPLRQALLGTRIVF